MGPAGRFLRTLVAIITAALFMTEIITGTFAIVLLMIASVFALTSFIGNYPLYNIFGINSFKKINDHGKA